MVLSSFKHVFNATASYGDCTEKNKLLEYPVCKISAYFDGILSGVFHLLAKHVTVQPLKQSTGFLPAGLPKTVSNLPTKEEHHVLYQNHHGN